MNDLVVRIAALQSTGEDGYAKGLFPAQRTHRYLRSTVEDNSIFFTAVTLYALQQVQDRLSEASRRRIAAMTERAVANYPRYLNNEGWPMYNFWQTQPEDRFFPNSPLLSRFRHFRLPEDIDTTAYIYLTQPHTHEDAARLKERLVLDANGTRRTIHSTLPKYRHLEAYSTWLAQPNMPLDFDVCALANLMLFIFAYDLPLNVHDEASLTFIASVIRDDDHVARPFAVAPWYANTSVILYHVARLLAAADHPLLTALEDKLVAALRHHVARDIPFMERLLCSTSLMRLGAPPAVTTYPDDLASHFGRFHFFVGSLLTAVDHPLAHRLAKYDLFHVRYRCRAHAWALVLEHEVLRC